MVWCQLRWTSE